MSNRQPKLLLLDANALIHRSFHAIPPLTTPKGELVNAVYGFANALLKAIQDIQPDYVVACFDAGRVTFRNEIYPQYKAHRKESDEALYAQIPRVKQIVEVLNIPLFAQDGVEADDLIGSLVTQATKAGIESIIVTGDNDALQLVDDSTSVYSLRRGVTDTLSYDRQAVKEKMGVFPDQIVEYKALAGDSSDNIPGAPGVGPKTASELLSKYNDLATIYEHLDELKPRLKEILTEHCQQVELSKRLAQIKTDLEIELTLDDAAITNFDFTKVVQLFRELDFKSLLAKLPKGSSAEQESLFSASKETPEIIKATLPYSALTDIKQLEELVPKLSEQPYLVFDTETVDLTGPIIGIALAWSETDSVYIPLGPHYPDGLDLEAAKALLSPILENKQIRKIAHNAKFDLHVLDRAGFTVNGFYFDTLIASQLINSQLFSHKLDDIALALLGINKIPITQLLKGEKDGKMNTVPLDELAAYSCEDALVTWRLWVKMRPDLEGTKLKKVFYEIEMPLLPILFQLEKRGIAVDRPYLQRLATKLRQALSEIEKKIHQSAGFEFNVASPAQLQKVLFEQLKLPVVGIKKIKSGYSTDSDSLSKLAGKHPLIAQIIEYREIAKLLSTYVETLPEQTDQHGRIHTTFQQLGAATGRLSSTNPNLQNIPIRTELGNEVRRAFVAPTGKLLLGVDYSQAELRVLAHLCRDQGLIKAFNEGSDFHAEVAAQLQVDRRSAKAINFGIIYGLGAQALGNDLGISQSEAKLFIDRYFTTFPQVRVYIEAMKELARSQGYVETIFGRRRYLPDIHSPNQMLRSGAERMAVNMPCQGTVADLAKLAMVRLEGTLGKEGELLLQIHDELLFEIESSAVKVVVEKVRAAMTSIVELAVPIVVEAKVGTNWADLEKL